MATVVQLTRVLAERSACAVIVGVKLRHYRGPADIEAWLELRRRGFARQRVGVGDWDESDFGREFLSKPWWTSEAMWFAELTPAAESEGQPIGTITLARRGSGEDARPVVHWLTVHPGYRRRGIGRLLLTTLEAAVWDQGGRQIWLETHVAWQEAARLYQSLGYQPID